MCWLLVLVVAQVLASQCVTAYPYRDYIVAYIPIEEFAYLASMGIEVIPLPYYAPVRMPTEPVTLKTWLLQDWLTAQQQKTREYRGQVYGEGAANIAAWFGNQGCCTYSSSSTPACPQTVPLVTSLPAVSLPSRPAISVPSSPMPSTLATINTVTTLPVDSCDDLSGPITFGGKVSASGSVKIFATFC